jgi:hypothetical protein
VHCLHHITIGERLKERKKERKKEENEQVSKTINTRNQETHQQNGVLGRLATCIRMNSHKLPTTTHCTNSSKQTRIFQNVSNCCIAEFPIIIVAIINE